MFFFFIYLEASVIIHKIFNSSCIFKGKLWKIPCALWKNGFIKVKRLGLKTTRKARAHKMCYIHYKFMRILYFLPFK